MKQQVKKMEEEEFKIATAKREKMKVMMMEIEHANSMALAMKEEKKLRKIVGRIGTLRNGKTCQRGKRKRSLEA